MRRQRNLSLFLFLIQSKFRDRKKKLWSFACVLEWNLISENFKSEATSTVFIAVLSAISFIALVGNFLVVITFFKTANLRTSSNYYIVNMAASDVLCSYFSWLVYATEGAITGRMWISDPLASVLCKIGIYVRVTSQIVSVLSLVAIAVDRYFAIVFPLRTTSMHKERVRFAILAATAKKSD